MIDERKLALTLAEMKDVPMNRRCWTVDDLRKIVSSGEPLKPPKAPVYPEEAQRLNRS
jgi:hypothetical protein